MDLEHRKPWLVSLAVVLATVLAVGVVASLWRKSVPRAAGGATFLAGYIADPAVWEQEHLRLRGRALTDSAARRDIERAGNLVREGKFTEAAAAWEALAPRLDLPAAYNNLGVVYMQLEDAPRAMAAFEKALDRSARYPPAQFNMQRLNRAVSGGDQVLRREMEPNDDVATASIIPLDASVDAEIGSGSDKDMFQFTAPPAPRDTLKVTVRSHSDGLRPGLSVFDAEHRFLSYGEESSPADSTLVQYLSPPPGATVYLQIWGQGGSTGRYDVVVAAMKAFDKYEPNDDIAHAATIPTGQTVEANIMDARDTDFYVFVAPHEGILTVEIRNDSRTLTPALSVFGADKRFLSFGPNPQEQGTSLQHPFQVHGGERYYLQVWPQGKSQGAYKLTVR